MKDGHFKSAEEHAKVLIENDWRKMTGYTYYSQDGMMRWTLFDDHAEKEIMGKGHHWRDAGQIAYELPSA